MRKKTRWGVVAFTAILALTLVLSIPEVSAAASKKPKKVTGLRVTSEPYNAVNIKWNKTKNAKKYQIYRATKRNGKYTKIKTISGVKFKNIKVDTGSTYWYKIRAINGLRKGPFSKVVKGTPSLKTPKFTVRSSAKGPKLTAVKVKGATGYLFYRNGIIIGKQKKLTFTDSDIAEKSSCSYKVRAYRKVGARTVVSQFSRTLRASKVDPRVKITGHQLVDSLQAGSSFAVTGDITSNIRIRRVEIGMVDRSTQKWVSGIKYDNKAVDAFSFDVSDAAKYLNFKKMYGGAFSYRIYAHLDDGSVVTVLNHTIIVSKGKGASAIVNMAKSCAWPYGTPKKKYKYKTGNRTEAYTAALKVAYGSRKGWGAQTKAGASCDVFAGTVIRASGYDKKFPRGLDGVIKHCKKNKDKWLLTGIKSVSKMKPGDIVYQEYKGGGGHIMVYMGNNRVANAHYMSKTYGVIEGKGMIQSKSSCRIYNVYRPIK